MSRRRAKPTEPERQAAAPGSVPALQGATSPDVVLYVDAHGYVVRAEYKARAQVLSVPSMAIDPAEHCAPSHATCDGNPDVPLPPWKEEQWTYGTFPMRTRTRRTPHLCVPCYMSFSHDDGFGHASEDWSAVESLRSEREAMKAAA